MLPGHEHWYSWDAVLTLRTCRIVFALYVGLVLFEWIFNFPRKDNKHLTNFSISDSHKSTSVNSRTALWCVNMVASGKVNTRLSTNKRFQLRNQLTGRRTQQQQRVKLRVAVVQYEAIWLVACLWYTRHVSNIVDRIHNNATSISICQHLFNVWNTTGELVIISSRCTFVVVAERNINTIT